MLLLHVALLSKNRYVRQRMGRNKLKSFGPVICRMAMLIHIRSGSFFFKALGITLLFMAGFPNDLFEPWGNVKFVSMWHLGHMFICRISHWCLLQWDATITPPWVRPFLGPFMNEGFFVHLASLLPCLRTFCWQFFDFVGLERFFLLSNHLHICRTDEDAEREELFLSHSETDAIVRSAAHSHFL